MKILLKDVIDRDDDCKGLLCSYYIKILYSGKSSLGQELFGLDIHLQAGDIHWFECRLIAKSVKPALSDTQGP
jgi:hypothetical protein